MFKITCYALNAFMMIQISDLLGSTLYKTTQNCESNTIHLSNLLLNACSNIGNTDNCTINFLQAVRLNNNQPSLRLLGLYAIVYFSGTLYNGCTDINATSSINGKCVSGYCTFVRCIRRVNSEFLIAQCYTEASRFNPAEEQEDQAILYKNITSCILAKTRCSRINPITGQPQNNVVNYDRFHKPVYINVPLYNALQINQAGDLRIIALPGTISIQNLFCLYESNLRETGWMDYNC